MAFMCAVAVPFAIGPAARNKEAIARSAANQMANRIPGLFRPAIAEAVPATAVIAIPSARQFTICELASLAIVSKALILAHSFAASCAAGLIPPHPVRGLPECSGRGPPGNRERTGRPSAESPTEWRPCVQSTDDIHAPGHPLRALHSPFAREPESS